MIDFDDLDEEFPLGDGVADTEGRGDLSLLRRVDGHCPRSRRRLRPGVRRGLPGLLPAVAGARQLRRRRRRRWCPSSRRGSKQRPVIAGWREGADLAHGFCHCEEPLKATEGSPLGGDEAIRLVGRFEVSPHQIASATSRPRNDRRGLELLPPRPPAPPLPSEDVRQFQEEPVLLGLQVGEPE